MSDRSVVEVIDAVLVHVPAEMTVLRCQLRSVADGDAYQSPESTISWQRLSRVLEGALSVPPQHDWEKKISDIVEGREQPCP